MMRPDLTALSWPLEIRRRIVSSLTPIRRAASAMLIFGDDIASDLPCAAGYVDCGPGERDEAPGRLFDGEQVRLVGCGKCHRPSCGVGEGNGLLPSLGPGS